MKRTFFCIAAWALVCWATTASAGESFEMVTDEDALVLSEWSPELQAATSTAKTDVPYAVETVAYSSASGNFYFWLDGFEVHTFPTFVICCTVRVDFGADLDNSDHRLFGLGMIKEPPITDLHIAHVIAGLIVANTIPFFACFALGDLLIPAPGGSFGFEKPESHDSLLFQWTRKQHFDCFLHGDFLFQQC